MESIDVDATGSIDYDEFLAATMNMSQLQVSSPAGTPCLHPLKYPPSKSHLCCCMDMSARVPIVDCLCSATLHRPSAVCLQRRSHTAAGDWRPAAVA